MQIFSKIPVIIVAAISANGYIGMDGQLPWQYVGKRLKGDLPRFQKTTIGNGRNAIIFGRNTEKSMPNMPLKDRYNCVLSTTADYQPPVGVNKFSSLHSAISACRASQEIEEIYVIGGFRPFAEALEIADKMILTITWDNYEGDVMFPEFDENQWITNDIFQFDDDRYDVREYYNLTIAR